VTIEDRLNAAKARLDQQRAETFRFERAGDVIAGTVARLDVGDTAYGEAKIVVLDPGDGNLRSVWLIHDALRSQMERIRPKPGDVIAVRYNGKVESQASGRQYHSYTVSTDQDKPGFTWDEAPLPDGPSDNDGYAEPAF
jgi:hypothetical protein